MKKFDFIEEDASLEKYNTYGIKTFTKYLAIPRTKEELLELIKYIKDNNLKYYILGKGSNVILPDTPFTGIIISLEKLTNVTIDNNIVTSSCGITLASLASLVIKHGLAGFEFLAGIPGSLGGALYGNAGSAGHDIYEYLKSVLVIRDEEFVNIKKEDIIIDYRYTSFKTNNDIIVEATFDLPYGDIDAMQEQVKVLREKRINSQPLQYKNAGSVFKNPAGDYAGRLIESVGLKDYHVNDAYVSSKHANFIINKGKATSQDIKDLIKIIKDKVYKETGVNLELEQIIVDWN